MDGLFSITSNLFNINKELNESKDTLTSSDKKTSDISLTTIFQSEWLVIQKLWNQAKTTVVKFVFSSFDQIGETRPKFIKTLQKAYQVRARLPADYKTNPKHWKTKKVVKQDIKNKHMTVAKGNYVYFIDLNNFLGSGASKSAYVGYDLFEQKYVTYLKIDEAPLKDSELITDLKNEIQMMKKFRGEKGEGVLAPIKHVVKDEHKNIIGLILEHYNGGDLSHVQRNAIKKFKETEIRQIVDDMAHGLEILNEREQIIHRDFKPGNVMLHRESDGRQRAKVIDFGLSITHAEQLQKKEQGYLPNLWGTSRYMAPELVVCHKAEIDPIPERKTKLFDQAASPIVDPWALGVTLFTMKNMRIPSFVNYEKVDTLYSAVSVLTDAEIDKEFSEEAATTFNNNEPPKTIEGVIRYAMACDPEKRYVPSQIRENLNRVYAEGQTWTTIEV